MASYSQSKVIHLLRSVYRLYQHIALPGRYDVRRFISSQGEALSADTCADIGAGTGPYRAAIARAFGVTQYISVDTAPSDQTTVCADCCCLPFRDATFDLVVGFDMITCIADYRAMLGETARVIKPGGHLILTYTFMFGESGVNDYRRWTLEGMNCDLKAFGFRVVTHRKRGGFLFSLTKLGENIVLNCVPGGRRNWRHGSSFSSIIRLSLVTLLLLPFQLLGWIALLIDQNSAILPVLFRRYGSSAARRRSIIIGPNGVPSFLE